MRADRERVFAGARTLHSDEAVFALVVVLRRLDVQVSHVEASGVVAEMRQMLDDWHWHLLVAGKPS